jgi:hypothetical protein
LDQKIDCIAYVVVTRKEKEKAHSTFSFLVTLRTVRKALKKQKQKQEGTVTTAERII